MTSTRLTLPILLLALPATRPAADAPRPASVDFVRDVVPILETHCYQCHGPTKQKSGLRLDLKAGALKGGDAYGPSIVPGKAAESPLIRLVSGGNDDLIMPPKGDRLSAAEVATLTRWINAGAAWPDESGRETPGERRDHWSFLPL